MNTTVRVVGDGPAVEALFRRMEAALTRFDPDSPLSRLNRHTGRWVVVPPMLYQAIRQALSAARMTDGAFDPTILPALMAAGYGQSFERGPTPLAEAVPAGRWGEVWLGPGAVWLPLGLQIDLGGIGKGMAVDGAMRLLRQRPASRLMVNAGGDLALYTEGDPWLVEVADPFRPERVMARFALRGGAAATSSTRGRRWGTGNHHIIDPFTGQPSESGLVAATVFAPSAARADALAKACVILGPAGALALLERRGCHGFLVTDRGDCILTPGLEEFRHAGTE